MSTGEGFHCPVNGWLDNDNAKEPSSRTVRCYSSGARVKTILTRTGTVKHAGSMSRVVAKICDAQGTCCQTSSEGRGLDNSEAYAVRRAGQRDFYRDTAILGSCSQKGSLVGDPKTVKLTTSDPDGTDGWYVEWIRITMSTGEVFSCPVDGWLDNDNPKEPSSRTVSCASSGEHVSTIASKTGTVKHAKSKSRVVAEICDAQGTCCQTSSDGRGLDNSKVVRQAGQTDVYRNTATLGSCSQKGSLVGDPNTVKLTSSDPYGTDGCMWSG